MKFVALFKLITVVAFAQNTFAGLEGAHEGHGVFYTAAEEIPYSVTVELNFTTQTYNIHYVQDNGNWSCLFEYSLSLATDDSFKVYSVKTNGVVHTSTQPLATGVIDRVNETFAIVTNHPSSCNDGNISHWSIHSNVINGKLVRTGLNLENTPVFRLRDAEI